MDGAIAQPARGGGLAALVDRARRGPGRILAVVLGLHLLVWTVLPILVCPNLQLDLAEDLALGKEWQLGYWKHPPLPWWIADLLYRLTGSIDSIYVLGPLAAVLCFYGVWRLAREVTGEVEALIAVLALEGIHFYNFSVVKFAHDQMQLPFWAFTGLFFYRALMRGRLLELGAGGHVSRRRVLVEIRGLRARGDARPVPPVRSAGAARLAHARSLRDGAGLRDRDRAERLVAGRARFHAVPLCRRARPHRRALVSIPAISAAMDREPGRWCCCRQRDCSPCSTDPAKAHGRRQTNWPHSTAAM